MLGPGEHHNPQHEVLSGTPREARFYGQQASPLAPDWSLQICSDWSEMAALIGWGKPQPYWLQ